MSETKQRTGFAMVNLVQWKIKTTKMALVDVLLKICYSKSQCAISKTKPVPYKPVVVKCLLPLSTVTFPKMRTISSKAILHFFSLDFSLQFNECRRPGSILQHIVFSIYHM